MAWCMLRLIALVACLVLASAATDPADGTLPFALPACFSFRAQYPYHDQTCEKRNSPWGYCGKCKPQLQAVVSLHRHNASLIYQYAGVLPQ